ncbi:sugar transferase [Terricaulis sp.]|uniref:sugar transferase n=1 Tax=Terricaulis sp. TaxID=2768686 RepID=UPI003782F92C
MIDAPPPVQRIAPIRAVHGRSYYQYRLARRPLGGALKRAFDMIAAATALAVLSPMLFVVALLVRAETPGPALFRQKRTGFRGRAFDVIKFRTMISMDDGRRIRQAGKGDARVTTLGKFLRRSSIDELPQLINVLRGDMSLVGPRPHAIAHDSWFFGVNNEYPRRFTARPGITGAAQVAGARGRTDTPEKAEERLRLDLAYVDNWSMGRDLAILLRTVLVVLVGRNAV